MAKKYNPGNVNISKATESILKRGGGTNSRPNRDGSTHHTVYSSSEDRSFSYDKSPDGKISNVHSSKNGHANMDYKGGR